MIHHLRHLLLLLLLLPCFAGVAADRRFVLLTTVDALHDGDVLIFVNQARSVAMAQARTSNFDGAQVSLEGNVAVPSDDVMRFTLKAASGKWRLANDGRYLCTTTNSGNGLKFTTKPDDTSLASISLTSGAGGDHIAVVKFDGKYKSRYLAYNVTGGTHHIFSCYPSADSDDYGLRIYKEMDIVDSLTLGDTLADDQNQTTINAHTSSLVSSLTLARTFAADGGWYTLCLPFGLGSSEISDAWGDAVVEEFAAVSTNDDASITVHFTRTDTIRAGTPYLLKPGRDAVDPVFHNKTITALAPTPSTITSASYDEYTFAGTFSPLRLIGSAYRILSGEGGTRFVAPNGEGRLKPLRAYFAFSRTDVEAKLSLQSAEATSVSTLAAYSHATPHVMFHLSGIPIPQGVTPRSGTIIVVDGRKVLVK